jgi:hypothetical protein
MGRFVIKSQKFSLNLAPEHVHNAGGILPILPLMGSLFMPQPTHQDPLC